MKVAALFVANPGVYFGLPDVDPWDVERDARNYDGPHPVVAHPPCGPWGRMAQFCHQDASCGPRAVEQVRKFGGVLEHPKGSRLWDECRMAPAGDGPDAWGGSTHFVNQVAWGHACTKPTWLYVVGVPRIEVARLIVESANFDLKPTHKVRNRTAGNLLQASRQMRSATPVGFRNLLLSIARSVGKFRESE